MLRSLLVLCQEEVEALILRLASSFPARKDQLLFLINNYDVVMSIIIERTRDDSKVQAFFLLDHVRINLYFCAF
jgi:hypothetical protein